jgi:hypothetical protein
VSDIFELGSDCEETAEGDVALNLEDIMAFFVVALFYCLWVDNFD